MGGDRLRPRPSDIEIEAWYQAVQSGAVTPVDLPIVIDPTEGYLRGIGGYTFKCPICARSWGPFYGKACGWGSANASRHVTACSRDEWIHKRRMARAAA